MSIYDKLQLHPVLLTEFKNRAAKPGVLSSDLLVWLRARPEMVGFHVPDCMRNLRLKLGVPAKQGGKRPQRGEIFYTVAGRGIGKGAA